MTKIQRYSKGSGIENGASPEGLTSHVGPENPNFAPKWEYFESL